MTLLLAAKILYSLTIPALGWYIIREMDKRQGVFYNIFSLILFTLYTTAAVLYVFDVAYHAEVGYVLWAVINGMFIYRVAS